MGIAAAQPGKDSTGNSLGGLNKVKPHRLVRAEYGSNQTSSGEFGFDRISNVGQVRCREISSREISTSTELVRRS